jgi:hypothetical protein
MHLAYSNAFTIQPQWPSLLAAAERQLDLRLLPSAFANHVASQHDRYRANCRRDRATNMATPPGGAFDTLRWRVRGRCCENKARMQNGIHAGSG